MKKLKKCWKILTYSPDRFTKIRFTCNAKGRTRKTNSWTTASVRLCPERQYLWTNQLLYGQREVDQLETQWCTGPETSEFRGTNSRKHKCEKELCQWTGATGRLELPGVVATLELNIQRGIPIWRAVNTWDQRENVNPCWLTQLLDAKIDWKKKQTILQ